MRHVRYTVKDSTFKVGSCFMNFTNPTMSEVYATHLFNTIDALIPGSQPITPQPGQSTPELPVSRPLPSQRRQPTGR